MLLARAITALVFVILYLPLAVMAIFSFLAQTEPGGPSHLSLDWYARVLSNRSVLDALQSSLWIGGWATLIATLIGTAAALAMVRTRFVGKQALDGLIHIPLVMPCIVLGLSTLVWFVWLRIPLGSVSVILAHVTFSVSYVVITVRARFEDFDISLEEAARDLGATPWQTFWKVTFPLIGPGILSGALMAFTLSFDDFLITFFTAGVGSDTLPLRIYAMIKFGVSPEINALSTLMLAATFALVLVFHKPFKKVMR